MRDIVVSEEEYQLLRRFKYDHLEMFTEWKKHNPPPPPSFPPLREIAEGEEK